ncbi:hypothetical protein LCGC14_2070340 [marine sediment metagenome]|uniref:Uncharacterized protein n=1 Tax=marine sediment metagenome TaxID=412755 RepID=A0A0F9HFN1_9ZZZZ
MATHQISILGATTKPDTSGKVWMEPYSILATNDVWQHNIFRFDQDGNNNAQISTRVGVYGIFTVPQNYVGSPIIIPVWTATVITGNCVWDFDYRAIGGNDTESLDQATAQESVTVTDAAPSAAHERLTPSLSPTAGNFAAGNTVEFLLVVDGTDASDTLAGARLLHNLIFQYGDA